jgi:hypothetical protein
MKQCRSVIGEDCYFKYSSYTTLVLIFLTAEMECKRCELILHTNQQEVAQFSALPGRIDFLWQAYTIHI